MKLISLWEPWATLMALGAKKIETRSWATSYRGWLAIQASKGGLSKRDLAQTISDPLFQAALGSELFRPGHIVAVVNLKYCKEICRAMSPGTPEELEARRVIVAPPEPERSFGDYYPGRYGWITDSLFRLPEPIPFKAKQGLCDVPDDVVRQIRDQFKGGAL